MNGNPTWFWTPKPAARPSVRLFCFPFACGGTLTYRTWPSHLPEHIEVSAVQLPGRERRYHDPPYRRMDRLVAALKDAIETSPTHSEVPCAFFGHSMGAIIAFELARALYETDHPCAPTHLLVSGRRAPQIRRRGALIHHTLPQPELVRRLRNLGGTPPAVFDDPDLLDMVLKLARADFELIETYRYRAGMPLPCAISAFRGRDDPEVTKIEASAWSTHTSSDFRLYTLPGNHFFLNTATEHLLTIVGAVLSQQPVTNCRSLPTSDTKGGATERTRPRPEFRRAR